MCTLPLALLQLLLLLRLQECDGDLTEGAKRVGVQDAPKAVTALKKLNVPYLVSLPLVFQTTEEWMDSELGVHPVQVALQVTFLTPLVETKYPVLSAICWDTTSCLKEAMTVLHLSIKSILHGQVAPKRASTLHCICRICCAEQCSVHCVGCSA